MLASRVHSTVKYSQQSQLRFRATVEQVCYTTACRGQSSLTLTYPTPDSGLTYTNRMVRLVVSYQKVAEYRHQKPVGAM